MAGDLVRRITTKAEQSMWWEKKWGEKPGVNVWRKEGRGHVMTTWVLTVKRRQSKRLGF